MSWIEDDYRPAKSSVGVPDCMIQKQWPKKHRTHSSVSLYHISKTTSLEEQSLIVEGQRVYVQSGRHSHRQRK